MADKKKYPVTEQAAQAHKVPAKMIRDQEKDNAKKTSKNVAQIRKEKEDAKDRHTDAT